MGGKLLNRLLRGCRSSCSRRGFSTSRTNAVREKMVMSFGDGSHGALGFSGSGDVYEPTQVSGLPCNVCGIAAGHYHSLAVTEDGHVWAWGRNHEAQLGRSLGIPRERWNEPQKVQGLQKTEVVSVAASGVVSLAIGKDGDLWTWGISKRGQLGLGKGVTESLVPQRINSLSGEKIVQVAAGWGHVLACTKEGKLFGWGYSADGRLGLTTEHELFKFKTKPNASMHENDGSASRFQIAEQLVLGDLEKEKRMPIVWEPCLIENLNNVRVVDIACGFDHSLVLSDNGLLFTFGDNTYGQLGKSSQDPCQWPLDLKFKIVAIAAGLGHSLAITADPFFSDAEEGKARRSMTASCTRSIFSWGWNSTSQLGRLAGEASSEPGRVTGLEGRNPVAVSAGRAHSMAISEMELWAWGCGRNGRLGLGSSMDEAEPYPVECLQGLNVVKVSCGLDHNLLLVEE